jgi:uncharacterized protein involved in exopolysaccharide biosynthesis
MYRPREPEERPAVPTEAAKAGYQTVTQRRSLLDQLDDRRERVSETYARRAVPEAPPERPAEIPAADGKSRMEGSIQAQIRSLSELGPTDLLYWLRSGLKWIIAATILGVIAAFLYSASATPRYTVFTDLIIDPQNLSLASDDVLASTPQRDSQLLEVESKLRVLTSRNVLNQVITDLNLVDDPEFTRPGALEGLFRLISPKAETGDKQLAILRELGERVSAGREERSFVVTLSVWTSDPEKSVKLSQAIVRAFESELFESAAQSTGRLAANLSGRLDELRASVTEAEEKVEQFKRSNSIQESNTGEMASSRISSALDTQVLDAQQRMIQADARYNQMRSAVSDRRIATATVFDSPGMQTLRASYNLLQQQIGSLALTYGARHPRLIALQSEEAALQKAISDEANRILESAKTDAEQARSALKELRGKADTERSTVYTNNDAQVRLRELERDAKVKGTVYETYLSRTHQINERQQIDTSNVRVISQPIPPKTKSWPPRTLILIVAGAAIGFIIGLGIACMLGLWQHVALARDRFARAGRFA